MVYLALSLAERFSMESFWLAVNAMACFQVFTLGESVGFTSGTGVPVTWACTGSV